MFKVNYMNVTLWSLGGFMVLFLIGSIIWRLKSKDDKDKKTNQLIVKKDIKDLSLSLMSIYEIPSLVNILFKNKFAKNKYSIIPMLAAKNDNLYLITNNLNLKVQDDFKITDEKFYKNNKIMNEINIKSYREILRYLEAMEVTAKILVPVNIDFKYSNKFNIVNIKNIGNYINDDDNKMNNKEIYKILKKIESQNIYKSKSVRGRQKNEF